MFYTKTQIGSTTIQTELNDETIFTTCFECGTEFCFSDFAEAFSNSEIDLYGTSFLCPECQAKRNVH